MNLYKMTFWGYPIYDTIEIRVIEVKEKKKVYEGQGLRINKDALDKLDGMFKSSYSLSGRVEEFVEKLIEHNENKISKLKKDIEKCEEEISLLKNKKYKIVRKE